MRGDFWTPENDARLTALWYERPTISGREIADRLGMTKNAIVGRVHRLKLTPRPSPVSAPHADLWTDDMNALLRRDWHDGLTAEAIGDKLGMGKSQILKRADKLGLPRRRAPRSGAAELLLAAAAPRADGTPAARPTQVSVFRPQAVSASPHRQCQWLEGEPREARFCHEPVQPRSSYCPAHHARCWHPKERAA